MPILYKVWGNIRVIDIISCMWGDHMYMWGDHKSNKRHEDASHVEGPYVHVAEPYDRCSI